ncbi:MAG: thioredoxin domain-containing protein [Gammaproteobacteria bacterium]
MSDQTHTNNLIRETSPYLLQHAHNPVDWHPWSETALAKARTENKPILLSIGYSACHWCHVMAHESFENADTAALMNRLYVNIKVDREERPDLDRVYQLAHQILAQRGGGWPLTVFLTPDDLTPFFAGTYFPLAARYGMPAFKEVLERVAGFYRDHQEELRKQNAALKDVFKRIESETVRATGALDSAPLGSAYRALSESFDPRFGGFGGAPKFPHPASLEFLLWRACDPKTDAETAKHSREMLETTLTRMAEGGIYDQLGGGFCRYSVDEEWTIPHFEKMLYDNGPLLALYAQAAKFSNSLLYENVARQTADWVINEMQSPQGGYYSSLDADSEGHEGKYYVWDREEVRRLLSTDEYAVLAPRYGLDRSPNFEGRWHLHVQQNIRNTATSLEVLEKIEHPSPAPLPSRGEGDSDFLSPTRGKENLNFPSPKIGKGTFSFPSPTKGKAAISFPSPLAGEGGGEGEVLLQSARTKLLAARQNRVRPGLDDKILTSWNGLMIRGMALAGRLLDEPRYIESALRATDFIRAHLWKDDRLLATWRDAQAKLPAYLDDYAFLLDGILELVQAHWDSGLFDFTRKLADALLAHFEDKQHGGFWFTANDEPTPLHRSKSFSDESLPAGNAVAARALLRLGHLCAEPRYLSAAERTLKAAMSSMTRQPEAHTAMLLALRDALEPPTMVVLRGIPEKLAEWRKVLDQRFDPRRIVLAIPDDAGNLMGLLEQCALRGDICAYICRGTQCSLPITRIAAPSEI